jgi:tetratricopeptide (TPR) repeat protein
VIPPRPVIVGALVLCVLAATPARVVPSQQLTLSLADALTYYEAGERDAVVRALTAARGSDAFALVPFFEKDSEAWIQADGPTEVDRRRLLVATFALETAYAGLDHQWEISKAVVQWACEMWRKSGPPTPAEHAWMLAGLALLEANFVPPSRQDGLANPEVRAHLKHITDRFPDEPRVSLALALLKEYEFWTGHYRVRGVRSAPIIVHNDDVAATVLPALEEAARQESNRPEAQLRRGFLEYRLGRSEAALADLSAAAAGDDDRTRTYLAHLFIGWVHERDGRKAEATASFRRAYETLPALSAALALGVRLYEDEADERDEADSLVEAALLGAAGRTDPWKDYGYGDLRRWPALIGELRSMAGAS